MTVNQRHALSGTIADGRMVNVRADESAELFVDELLDPAVRFAYEQFVNPRLDAAAQALFKKLHDYLTGEDEEALTRPW